MESRRGTMKHGGGSGSGLFGIGRTSWICGDDAEFVQWVIGFGDVRL